MKAHINRNIGKTRSGEVVVHSMISSQLACVLTSIAPHLVVILNGFIVSRFLGVECFKAISVFNPISGIVLLLISSCCIGPSIHAGKSYGELNISKANNLFSLATMMACTVGVLFASTFFAFRNGIAETMTSDQALQRYLVDYIRPICLYLPLSAVVCILNSFVTASGYVKKVTQAVIASGVMNVVSILILVNLFHSGVEAAGIAMCISALTNILILLPLVMGKRFPFRFVIRIPEVGRLVKENVSVWISVNSGSLADGLFVFLSNLVILRFLPSDGLFIWGVCQMASNTMYFIAAGIYEAYYYVDAFLIGEGDNAGRLKIAKSLSVEIFLVMIVVASIFTLLTEKFAILFGADTPQLVQSVGFPLICVIWFSALKNALMSFGSFSIQYRPVIKLSYDFLVAVATPAMVFIAAILFGGGNLWLGFAFTPLLLVLFIVIFNIYYCRKDNNLIPFFLLNKIHDIVTLDFSISYNKGNMKDDLAQIRTFLNICEISDTLAGKIELCCEELMVNIQGMQTDGHTYDLRLSDCEDSVNLVVKSLGKPISPVIKNNLVNDFLENGTIPDNKELRMFYILHCSDTVDYRYVFGMNVAVLSFNKN